jgi:uncharacterized protein YbjT (DUF2867 family)
MKIVVAGGTGRAGTAIVSRLAADGHEAVAASPTTGVDVITCERLAEVMDGADVLVDATSPHVFDDDVAMEFFTTGTRNLLTAEADAGVGHHLAMSIVGIDNVPDLGYYRAKVAQQAAIEAGSIAYTILRATQFFEFLPVIAAVAADGDGVRLPPAFCQPVAVDDVAAVVAELVTDEPLGGRVELAGPEALGLDEWARRLFAATGDERTVVTGGTYFGAELTSTELTPEPGASRIGPTGFDAWLAAQNFPRPQPAG